LRKQSEDEERRSFLKLLGASLALAGLSGCTRAPRQKIVPYVTQPPEVTPGVATHYATAIAVDGYATGLLVESREGRPVKIEGNPRHPASLGATSAIDQAWILSLYDPARARGVRRGRAPSTLRDFEDARRRARGALHVLAEPTSSPTTIALLERLFPNESDGQLHYYAPLARDAAWHGAAIAFGRPLEVQLDLSQAEVIVALDADLLGAGPSALRATREFSDRRRVRSSADTMNRLYVIEPALTVTGGIADHRFRVRHGDVAAIAFALLAAVAPDRKIAGPFAGPRPGWIEAIARDLRAHAGRSLVVVGDAQPAPVHALVHLINAALANFGRTLKLTESPIHRAGQPSHGLEPLLLALDAKRVDTLLILGGNPVYAAPADLELGRRLASARERVYLGLYENETARACNWFIPAAHPLEGWADVRASDGTVSLAQPLIEPLYAGRTRDELIALLLGIPRPKAQALLREYWQKQWTGESPDDFKARWDAALRTGVVEGSTLPELPAMPDWEAVLRAAAALPKPADGLEIGFPSDSRVRDGAFTNNAWLLELPDPITKLTWENALWIGKKTAAELALSSEDVVEVTLRGRSLEVPVFVVPGQADGSVSLALGYGREGEETLARGLGVNANLLRSARAPRFEAGVSLRKTGRKHTLATTQTHWALEGREIVRHASLDEYRRNSGFARRPAEPTATLYKLPLLGEQQWGMSIDLSACTGCSACVIACQAENNTPIVGKQGVLMNREMHWIRIDRYFEGTEDDPRMLVQPMLCQHCEKAPCEYVCPVNATVHSPDGLNEQAYNRCVGTRFCSNNCAWKVRRFNWFNYHELATRGKGADARALQAMAKNPDVSVRARGVMEKCTYCVQRIRRKGIAARLSGRPEDASDVVTACAQACPARAIVFGSLTAQGSELAKLRNNEREYAVLGELGTEPRTRYLARLDNLNPELAG
jgi:Fe-S-cluster-containing dehydrogenase component